MPGLEFKPTTLLLRGEINDVGTQLHNLVSDSHNEEMLDSRHLWGVIERHGRSRAESIEAVVQTWEGSRAAKLGAFVIFEGGVVLGMATAQKDLPLYRQRLPLPARFTRNAILGERLSTPESNVAAWVDASYPAPESQDTLEQAYRFLRNKAPSSWTIEPILSGTSVHSAITNAGFRLPTTSPAPYDDYEAGNRAAPIAHYYVAQDAPEG